MVTLSDGEQELQPDLLSPGIQNGRCRAAALGNDRLALKDQVESLERNVIDAALRRHAGNISHVAEELGLSRVGLRSKIARYDLRRDLDDNE